MKKLGFVEYIFIHCSATRKGNRIGAKQIDRIHKRRGWLGCGYHYIVTISKGVEIGRSVEYQGAHVKGFNHNSIGVCYIGGLDKNGKPADTRTKKQKKELEALLIELKKRHPNAKIVGHRDVSRDLNGNGLIEKHERIKECPCFDAITEYAHI